MSKQYEIDRSVMGEDYWKLWNSKVQDKIDRDIEVNRKADASIKLAEIPAGAEVKVEQVSHDYIFGAHIFNFNQLGTDERNEKYKELYGTFFNSATVPFYWGKFEPVEGKPRFKGEYRDTAEYWNSCTDPKNETHWRRPATDPIVEFCEDKGIRIHGHVLTWGNNKWHTPEWLLAKLPKEYADQILPLEATSNNRTRELFDQFNEEQLEKMLPEFISEITSKMASRIFDIANYYKDRLISWDVVNESACDVEQDRLKPFTGVGKSRYGLMPGDYPYKSLKIADAAFPKNVELNINDYNLSEHYVSQVEDLLERDCKIDIVGAQKHIFDPEQCLDIADGKIDVRSPEKEWADLERLATLGKPIHMSEITLCAPNNDERGQAIQAIMARNLYRLWFSFKNTMGITWWNVVDDCGAPGEPSVSGLFSRNMEPKPAFHALNDLINNEWKTKTTVKADNDGLVEFRGFKGNYKLTWTDKNGVEHCTEIKVKQLSTSEFS